LIEAEPVRLGPFEATRQHLAIGSIDRLPMERVNLPLVSPILHDRRLPRLCNFSSNFSWPFKQRDAQSALSGDLAFSSALCSPAVGQPEHTMRTSANYHLSPVPSSSSTCQLISHAAKFRLAIN